MENTGSCKGDEVVQLYVKDVVSSVITPVKVLRGFKRITLESGKKKPLDFTIMPHHLSLLDRNMNCIVEPGIFEVQIGSSSEDIRLKGSFEIVTGEQS